MTILQFPDKANNVYVWTKNFVHKHRMQGSNIASRYLRENVPSQFHKQVMDLAHKALQEKRNRT